MFRKIVFTYLCTVLISADSASELSGTETNVRTNPAYRVSRVAEEFKYGFRPRSIPLRRSDETEKPVYYAKDNLNNGYKTEILFPGNYYSISKEKSDKRTKNEPDYSGAFTPQIIPLIRGQTFEKRSLDIAEEPTLEKPEENSDYSLMKRSISYILGGDDEEDDDDDDVDYVREDDADLPEDSKSKIKKKIRKVKKYSKYMMPLLLAYKLKYFALVPVLISGLVLLVGVTGMAGFFFALFAAVMGLQKGGY